MDVLERIEKGELIVAVWPFGNDFTTEESRKLREELLQLAELGQQTQWVSVVDDLPKKDSLVDILIDGTDRVVNVIYSDNQKKYLWTDEYEEYHWRDIEAAGEKITHWMYTPDLPPAPKEAE